jgi:predicted lipid-binding transport protein (Tim44 family)
MMDMNGMMDRCIDAMGSMMGGTMMGSGTILLLLFALFLVWVVGLGVVGALIFWGVRSLSSRSTTIRGAGATMHMPPESPDCQSVQAR